MGLFVCTHGKNQSCEQICLLALYSGDSIYNAETLSPVARCTVCDGLQQTPPQRAAESSVRGRCARISAFPLQGGGAELLLSLDLPRECDLR